MTTWTTTPPDKPGYYWFRLLDVPAMIFKVELYFNELEVRTYDGQTVALKDWPFTGGEWLPAVVHDELVAALNAIKIATNPDYTDNYRADDREGCFDYVFDKARAALGKVEG